MATSARSVRSPWWIAVVAGMASFLDAGAIVATGTALVLFQEELGLDGGAIARLSSLLTVMIAIGAFTGGRLGDRFGRRRVFTVTVLMYVAGMALLVAAPQEAVLYLGMLLVGFAAGADLPVSLAMIAESAPAEQRGRMVSFTHVLWVAGILAPTGLAIAVGDMGATGGRILYGMLLVVAVVVLVLRAGLPESQVWIDAHEAQAQSPGGAGEASIGQLLRSRYMVALVGVSLFYAIGNITANTLGQFSTYLWVNVAGSTVSTASTISLVSYAFNLVAMALLVKVVDTRYRMAVFALGGAITVAAYLIPALAGVSALTLTLLVFLSALGGPLAGEPLFKVWSQELFPTLYRGSAQGIAIAVTRLVAAAAALVTPSLIAVGPQLFFVLLVGTTLCSLAIGGLWVARMPRVDDAEPGSADAGAVLTEGAVPAPGAGGER